MKKGFTALLSAAFFTAGCQTITHIPGPTLSNKNFIVLKSGASADSYGVRLFGIFPLVNPSRAKAEAKIYQSAGGNLEGRAVTLNNQTEERSVVYLGILSIPKLTITGDVIEFTESAQTVALTGR